MNLLKSRLKHAKKEQKEDAVQFEQQLQMIMQKLNDRENNWSEEHKKLSEEDVEMITNLRKLWIEMDEQKIEIKKLKRANTTTETTIVKFQSQLKNI